MPDAKMPGEIGKVVLVLKSEERLYADDGSYVVVDEQIIQELSVEGLETELEKHMVREALADLKLSDTYCEVCGGNPGMCGHTVIERLGRLE